jgi:hypothetical protein
MLTLCLLLKQDRSVYTSQQYEQGIHVITVEIVNAPRRPKVRYHLHFVVFI